MAVDGEGDLYNYMVTYNYKVTYITGGYHLLV